MSPRHAYVAGASVVIVATWILVWVFVAAGRDDDRQGRPRG